MSVAAAPLAPDGMLLHTSGRDLAMYCTDRLAHSGT